MQAQPATSSSTSLGNPLRGTHLRVALVAAATALLVLASLALPNRAYAYPPDIPSKSQVQSELNAITVRAEGPRTGYSRSLFPHWISQGNNCNTREVVLKRDGRNVVVGSDCYPDSGSWYSEFDGQTRTVPSQISIDHVVALAEAWDSGASSWSTSRRQAFANDLSGPQLIAVTTEVNSSKSDKDIAQWVPPLSSKRCAFAKMVIHTKYRWGLTMDSAEKSAAQTYLNQCSY
ncbi:HNH endonuclease [Myceligenerans sp. TRM 65318]|uniref:HNH endonuclease n=2 Tax=Myceligenerans pegani TaxID=2776917 RepID=A0ABR9N1A1_9MICO|nr:HNH endonuclease [Myceligenerans sp. TRM 65318]MBE3019332.1 HNH endonuclease [Myceligenerans sp. TRM 65318]